MADGMGPTGASVGSRGVRSVSRHVGTRVHTPGISSPAACLGLVRGLAVDGGQLFSFRLSRKPAMGTCTVHVGDDPCVELVLSDLKALPSYMAASNSQLSYEYVHFLFPGHLFLLFLFVYYMGNKKSFTFRNSLQSSH